jgi:hypothetical protein
LWKDGRTDKRKEGRKKPFDAAVVITFPSSPPRFLLLEGLETKEIKEDRIECDGRGKQK